MAAATARPRHGGGLPWSFAWRSGGGCFLLRNLQVPSARAQSTATQCTCTAASRPVCAASGNPLWLPFQLRFQSALRRFPRAVVPASDPRYASLHPGVGGWVWRQLEWVRRRKKSASAAAGSHDDTRGHHTPLWWRVWSPPPPLQWCGDGEKSHVGLPNIDNGGSFMLFPMLVVLSSSPPVVVPLATPRVHVSFSATW